MTHMQATRIVEALIHERYVDASNLGDWFEISDVIVAAYEEAIHDERRLEQLPKYTEPPRRTP